MKIDNKFAELCCFIENPKAYEVLYSKDGDIHNEYAVDLEEAKRIISTIANLQQENRNLKERISYLERSNNRREIAILEQKEEISDLEDKIDKAIEYIEDRLMINEETGEYWLPYTFDKCNLKELHDILKEKINE